MHLAERSAIETGEHFPRPAEDELPREGVRRPSSARIEPDLQCVNDDRAETSDLRRAGHLPVGLPWQGR